MGVHTWRIGARLARHTAPWHLVSLGGMARLSSRICRSCLACRILHIAVGTVHLALVNNDVHPARRRHLNSVAKLSLTRSQLKPRRVVSHNHNTLQRTLRDVRKGYHTRAAPVHAISLSGRVGQCSLTNFHSSTAELVVIILQTVKVKILVTHNCSLIYMLIFLIS